MPDSDTRDAATPDPERENAPLCRAADLTAGLRAAGLNPGDTALLHSSLKSVGRTANGPATVIEALLDALGPNGTLLMPTFTGTAHDSAARPPVFDVERTPCYTGAIPETFRRRAGVRRSLHPTHSVAALGPRTDFYLRDHERAPTPCGWETPFGRLIQANAKILFLGATLESCTLFHACEEFAELEYHMQPGLARATVILPDATTLHPEIGLHWWNPDAVRDYPALEPVLARTGCLRFGRACRATLRLMHAAPTHAVIMRHIDRDPTVLLARRTQPVPNPDS